MAYFLPESLPILKKEYPGWGILTVKLNEVRLKASDIKRILGISYRQLNDWENRGMLMPKVMRSPEIDGKGWRKFKILDLFSLGLLKKIKGYGIPITKYKDSLDMIFFGFDYMWEGLPYIFNGRNVIFYTNLDSWTSYYFMEPDEKNPQFPMKDFLENNALFIIPMNRLIDDIFKKLDLPDFKAIKNSDGSYSFIIYGVPLKLEKLPKRIKRFRSED